MRSSGRVRVARVRSDTDAEKRAALDEREALMEARTAAMLDLPLTENAHRGRRHSECRPPTTTSHELAQGRTRDRRVPRPLPHHRRRSPRRHARVSRAEHRRRTSTNCSRSSSWPHRPSERSTAAFTRTRRRQALAVKRASVCRSQHASGRSTSSITPALADVRTRRVGTYLAR